jgi:hypothetical protein
MIKNLWNKKISWPTFIILTAVLTTALLQFYIGVARCLVANG